MEDLIDDEEIDDNCLLAICNNQIILNSHLNEFNKILVELA